MKLREWLAQNDITQTEFAKKVGVSPSRITHFCKDGIVLDGRGRPASVPSHETALAILRATGGAVTPAEMGVVLPEATLILARSILVALGQSESLAPPRPDRTWGRKPKSRKDDAPAAAPLPTRQSEGAD
jgi:transcriptional regulator with XRE-family HTH domain